MPLEQHETSDPHPQGPAEKLFADSQIDMFEKSYEEQLKEDKNRPVECLGMTFENDEKRREYFLEKLREKLKAPEFCKIEGFSIGEDDDILALADPPYYTACPNPFIEDFIKQYGEPHDPNLPFSREPFAADVSEGKNDPIYNAHSSHTKVPHKALMRYILHYTRPGELVFDGFCGTGMTGVAAQLCGDAKEIEALGYRIKVNIPNEFQQIGIFPPEADLRPGRGSICTCSDKVVDPPQEDWPCRRYFLLNHTAYPVSKRLINTETEIEPVLNNKWTWFGIRAHAPVK